MAFINYVQNNDHLLQNGKKLTVYLSFRTILVLKKKENPKKPSTHYDYKCNYMDTIWSIMVQMKNKFAKDTGEDLFESKRVLMCILFVCCLR